MNASVWEEHATIDGLKEMHRKYPTKMKAIGECGRLHVPRSKRCRRERAGVSLELSEATAVRLQRANFVGERVTVAVGCAREGFWIG